MKESIGKFIKEQREKRNISQNKLAELLFVDRTLISKWENNKATPVIEEIIKMADIFGISVEEFLSGEEYSIDNKEEIQHNLNDFLLKQENSLRKAKHQLLHILIVGLIILFIFLGYYFHQTYNKTKVYRISGSSDNYYFNSGILIITRGKSYFKIGQFNSNIDKIKIYYNDDGRQLVIYEGDANETIIDLTGYDCSINLSNFNKLKSDIYMIIYYQDSEEVMKLNFKEDFKNNNLLFDNDDKVLNSNDKNNENIPPYIKEHFTCDDDSCRLEEDGMNISYDINLYTFNISGINEFLFYDIKSSYFGYSKCDGTVNFEITENNYSCDNISEEDAKKIYDKYMIYISKYLAKEGE